MSCRICWATHTYGARARQAGHSSFFSRPVMSCLEKNSNFSDWGILRGREYTVHEQFAQAPRTSCIHSIEQVQIPSCNCYNNQQIVHASFIACCMQLGVWNIIAAKRSCKAGLGSQFKHAACSAGIRRCMNKERCRAWAQVKSLGVLSKKIYPEQKSYAQEAIPHYFR